jgi:TolA-binding protein
VLLQFCWLLSPQIRYLIGSILDFFQLAKTNLKTMASTLRYKFSKTGLRAISNPKQLLLEAVTSAASQSPLREEANTALVQELDVCRQQLLEQQQRVSQMEQQLQKLDQRLQHSHRRCERQQEQLTSAEQRYRALREQFHQTQRRTGNRQPVSAKQSVNGVGKREVSLPPTISVSASNAVASNAVTSSSVISESLLPREPLPSSAATPHPDAKPSYRKRNNPVDLPRFPDVSAS